VNNISYVDRWDDDIFCLEVLRSKKLILLEFYAGWSGASHILEPILDSIANHYNHEIRVCKMEFDNNKEIADKYGVTEIPVILFFKDGRLVDKIIGIISNKEITKRITSILDTKKEKYWE
jgi:thioredoxin